MAQNNTEADRLDAKIADLQKQEILLETTMGPRGDVVVDRVDQLNAHGSISATEDALRREMAAVGSPPPDEGKIRQMAEDAQKVVEAEKQIEDLKREEAALESQKRNSTPPEESP